MINEPMTVYNFEVEDWHTYYVSDNGILVHNSCGMNNLRTLQNTTIKGYKVSMDLERGGSGALNLHVKVDSTKYFYNFSKEIFLDAKGNELPNALRNHTLVLKALQKALDALDRGW